MLGILGADDSDPVLSDAVFEGIDADFIAVEDPVEDTSHIPDLTPDGAIVLGDPTQIGDQVFGLARELVRLFRHWLGLDRWRGGIVEWIAMIE